MSIFQKITEAQRAAKAAKPVDVAALAAMLDIPVKLKFLPEDVSGSLERTDDGGYLITVNAMHPETRQRFTIAHELGHYIHHRALIGDGVNDSRAYRTTRNASLFNPNIGPRHETEANQFAASLLMPSEAVAALRASGMSVDEMARRLKVSRHAMSIRLGVPYT